jgi:quinol monooxygenase YgiN
MIIVEGWARIGADAIAQLQPAIRTVVTATLAEDGCISYAMSQDLSDPDVLRIAEKWVDDAALASHFQAPHVATYNLALAEIRATEAAIHAYVSDGKARPIIVRP